MTNTESITSDLKHGPVTPAKRASLWLICLAMIFMVALKPDRVAWPHFHIIGWVCLAASFLFAWLNKETLWLKTITLFSFPILILYFTTVDSNFTDQRLLEFAIFMVGGILIIPALLAKYWLKTPLKYPWLNGKWSWKMWLWLPAGFILIIFCFYIYFYILTPDLHTSWPLVGEKNEALSRIFWTCQLGGFWDELVWINFIFALMSRHFSIAEANLAQACFFTSFLYDVAFFGWGPLFLFPFALIQGYTYKKTGSLLFLVILHFMVDLVLFFMISNKHFPGMGI